MKGVISFILACLSLVVNADSPSTINVDVNQSEFTISLPANPTTGYQWTVVKMDNELLEVIDNTYESSNTKRIGAGGEMVFTFKLHSQKSYPKTSKLTFKYARPWEKDAGKLKIITINFIKKETKSSSGA